MSIELYIAQQLINAISLGSLYALVAIGLSLIFGILRMANFAHGDMMMVGAFATLVLQWLGFEFGWAVAGGIAVGALAGVLVERVAYRPVRGAPEVTMLLTSFAVTYILENLGILIFSSSGRNLAIAFLSGQAAPSARPQMVVPGMMPIESRAICGDMNTGACRNFTPATFSLATRAWVPRGEAVV
jgi:branched-subunit amino acid ABC-type transport system permease component